MSGSSEGLAGKAAALEGELLHKGEGGEGSGEAPGGGEQPAGSRFGDLIATVLFPTFTMLAPNWKITRDECVLLGETYGALADKYFPDLDLGIELAALFATAAVFGPRAGVPRHEPKPAKETDAETSAAG